MAKRDKILAFVIKPPMWACVIVWVLGAVLLTGSITLYYAGLGMKMWAVAVHVGALVFVLLSVYAVLTLIGISVRLKNSLHVRRFFADYNFRAFVYATCSFVLNACYVAFGIIIAVLEHSPWLGALVGYHVFLVSARLIVLASVRSRGGKSGKPDNAERDDNDEISEDDEDDENDKRVGMDKEASRRTLRAYAECGLALVLLSFAMTPIVRLTMSDENSYNYFIGAIAYVCAIAAYTFTKLGISIRNLNRVRKTDDLSLKAVKNISFADALISLFALQAMMLKELDGVPPQMPGILNPILGAAVSAAVFALGIFMTVRGIKLLHGKSSERE